MDVKKVIGENIRYERQRRNMSLEDLAEMIGITPGFLGLVERGHRGTDIVNLIKICEIFEVTIDHITTRRKNEILRVAEKSYNTVEAKRTTLNTLLYDLSAGELDFCISVVRSLKEMRHIDS